MKKRSITMISMAFVLLVFGMGGYLFFPSPPPDPLPIKIALPAQTGNVVFTHGQHIGYLLTDGKDSANLETAQKSDELCQKCHHDLAVSGNRKTSQGYPEVFACWDCHGTGDNPTFIQEHQERFYATDPSGAICIACHHEDSLPETDGTSPSLEALAANMQNCSDCHDNIPDRMSAFHDQCRDCHDQKQKGPGKNAPCAQCHTP